MFNLSYSGHMLNIHLIASVVPGYVIFFAFFGNLKNYIYSSMKVEDIS